MIFWVLRGYDIVKIYQNRYSRFVKIGILSFRLMAGVTKC